MAVFRVARINDYAVLSNFHLQSIFIRATDYFILILKYLIHF